MVKIVVVIPARNEEQVLPNTLKALTEQSIPVEKIIVVNDGSTDKTHDVALQYPNVVVVDREDRGFDAVGKAVLAETFNAGFKRASHEVPDYDYVLVVGADTVLPPHYIERLLKEFEENPDLVMASGIIKGEAKRYGAKESIRGTGRLIKASFWKAIGEQYPVKVGWESYPIYKAMQLGYETKGIPDLVMSLQRPTGKRTDYYAYGEAMRALGYYWLLAFGRALLKKNPKIIYAMLKGYVKGKERYEEYLRKFVKAQQKRRIRKLLFRF